MSSIAVTCGLIILVLLVIMLLAGVPIAVALAVSSIAAILPVLNTGAAVLTGAQRIFSGISVFSLLAIPFFILAGNLMNKGGIAIRLINFAGEASVEFLKGYNCERYYRYNRELLFDDQESRMKEVLEK